MTRSKIIILSVLLVMFTALIAKRPEIKLIGKSFPVKDQGLQTRVSNYKDGFFVGILVLSNIEGLSFSGYLPIEKVEHYRAGSYLLYVSPHDIMLHIDKDGHRPLKIMYHRDGIPSLKGGEVWAFRITTDQSDGLDVPEDVTALGPPGQMWVSFHVDPPDAQVYIDGINRGTASHVRETAGSHRIRIVRTGYKTIHDTVNFGSRSSFRYFMETADPEKIIIRSNPSGATVRLDGAVAGTTERALFLHEGVHHIELSLPGYATIRDTLRVDGPGERMRTFDLVRELGFLALNLEPRDARLLLDGKPLSPDLFADSLTVSLMPGRYLLEVSAPGYHSQKSEIQIELQQTLFKNIVLERREGVLQFNVTPIDATAELRRDTLVVKKWSGPAYIKELPIGEYTLICSAPHHLTDTRIIDIPEARRLSVDITLQRGLDSAAGSGGQMIFVAGGNAYIGDVLGEGLPDESPVVPVKIDDLYVGCHETTQGDWVRVMGYNPSITVGDRLPVHNISWLEALLYCNRRSRLDSLETCYTISRYDVLPPGSLPGSDSLTVSDDKAVWHIFYHPGNNGYRLPTEAEWEFLARAERSALPTKARRYAGDDIPDTVGWCGSVSPTPQPEVPKIPGQRKANTFGLYDMTGNVAEWCWDTYRPLHDNEVDAIFDPSLPRVFKGGSVSHAPFGCRVSARGAMKPFTPQPWLGLRVLRNAESQE